MARYRLSGQTAVYVRHKNQRYNQRYRPASRTPPAVELTVKNPAGFIAVGMIGKQQIGRSGAHFTNVIVKIIRLQSCGVKSHTLRRWVYAPGDHSTTDVSCVIYDRRIIMNRDNLSSKFLVGCKYRPAIPNSQ